MKYTKSLRLLFVVTSLSFTSSLAIAGGHAAEGLAPEKALKELRTGNSRYVTGKAAHAKQDQKRRQELTQGQWPHTIVLSCSDSRTAPELVFDQGLGEIFTVRVAGNILGAAAVASMEYAVEHLGSRLIVVMGHESCGAVKAALNTPADKSAGSPDLDQLVSEIRPNIAGTDRKLASTDKTIRGPVKMNVDGVAKRLLQRSKIINKAVEEGRVSIVNAVYALDSGKVDFWNTGKLE